MMVLKRSRKGDVKCLHITHFNHYQRTKVNPYTYTCLPDITLPRCIYLTLLHLSAPFDRDFNPFSSPIPPLIPKQTQTPLTHLSSSLLYPRITFICRPDHPRLYIKFGDSRYPLILHIFSMTRSGIE